MQRHRAVSQVVLQFWSVWVPASLDDSQAVAVTMEQISRVWQLQQQYAPLFANHFTLPLTLPPPFRYPDTFKVCLSAADVDAAAASVPPKIASLIGMEGGHSIGGSIETLAAMYATVTRAKMPVFYHDLFLFHSIDCVASFSPWYRYKAGARYMTLTHSLNNAWADSATDASRSPPSPSSFSPSAFVRFRQLTLMFLLTWLAATTSPPSPNEWF